MADDPLGLQSNPLFKVIGKIANPESYRGLSNLGQGQSAKKSTQYRDFCPFSAVPRCRSHRTLNYAAGSSTATVRRSARGSGG